MLRTPNTLDAHRLIWLAGREGVQDAVMEAVFAAYFTQGRDIGDRDVLADCAAEGGMDRAAVADFLAGDVAAKEMLAADRAAREAGVNGVPSFFLDGYSLYSGAMPAETMAEALRKGHQILRQRAGVATSASLLGTPGCVSEIHASAIVGGLKAGARPCRTRRSIRKRWRCTPAGGAIRRPMPSRCRSTRPPPTSSTAPSTRRTCSA